MKYECNEVGFEDAFIEFAETGWTRRTLREMRSLNESDAWFALLREKVTAVSLPTVEGEPIAKPEDLTPDALDRLDNQLYNWLTAVIVKAIREVAELGNAVWRRQFPSVAAENSAD